MFRFNSRRRRAAHDIHHPGLAPAHGLHEAKLSAWELAVGERRPSVYPPFRSRRRHRGLADDLPEPEPPPRRPERRIVAALRRLGRTLGRMGQRPAVQGAFLSAAVESAADEGPLVRYLTYRGIRAAGRRASSDTVVAMQPEFRATQAKNV